MQLPHSIEVEQALLSIFLSDPKSHYAIDKIKPQDFYNRHNQVLMESIHQLNQEGKTIDLYTVFEQSKKIHEVDIKYITEIFNKIPIYDTLENYIYILKEKSVLRGLIQKCNDTLIKAYNDRSNPMELKLELAQALDDMTIQKTVENHHIKDIFHSILDQIENYDPAETRKFLTGITELDLITQGMHREEVTILAARPGAGKTALGLQIGTKLAVNGLRVYIVSREMSKEQMAKRILTAYGANGKKLKANNLNESEQAEVISIMSALSNLNMFIDTESRTVQEIKQKIREYKADVVMIDYLQLLQPTNSKVVREQQVSELSREIKNISLDFKIPILLLSQLNRGAQDRRPFLGDLRESGAIEQDANNVWFIHVPQKEELEELIIGTSGITYNLLKKVKEMGARLVEIIVAKQRDGETSSFYGLYIPHKLQFVGLGLNQKK